MACSLHVTIETPHLVRTVSSVILALAKADMKHPMAREVKRLSNTTSYRADKQASQESAALVFNFQKNFS